MLTLRLIKLPCGSRNLSTVHVSPATNSLYAYRHTFSLESIAKILVYSMAVDGEERDDTTQKGYKAGCRALDSLDRLITSTESFFHPSNSGPWTIIVSSCCPGRNTLF